MFVVVSLFVEQVFSIEQQLSNNLNYVHSFVEQVFPNKQ